ncbi:MAG: NAD(P)H-dependent oxidoreductase [Lachnospiraceae bacterium]|nr:NAD(P)H-dependent oxidoreductase [Lachnospiraceae bacterium]
MILYVNCCARENSRTDILAREVVRRIGDSEVEEINLYEKNLKPMDRQSVARRDRLSAEGDFSDPMFDFARQFMKADTVVIGAPFWDYSFPSVLKIYIENIFCVGLISVYDEKGNPHGMCRAKKLYYVSTAGGQFLPEYGYEWIKAVVTRSFGIPETKLIYAENLDIVGNNPDAIMEKAIASITL